MAALENGLARERAFLGTSVLLFIASAGVTIHTCTSMSGSMTMPGGWTMSMVWMRMAGQTKLAALVSFMGVWLVMMLAMMLPSLVPMLLQFRRSVRGQAETHLGWLTTIAAAGYFFIWVIFGAVVYQLGVTLSAAEMRWPTFVRSVPLATGVALLLAGGVQLMPWKARQLGRCRNAPVCGSRCPTAVTTWLHGCRLGADCSLCCAGFMTFLVVNGVMSLATMAAVTALITVERLVQDPRRIARAIGIVIITDGLLVIARAVR
jgi:predicted metal-binding membrane protein